MIPPVVRSVAVPWDQAAAFRRFTAEIHAWWPLRTHSLGGEAAERCAIEPRVGGRFFERDRDGTEHTWGTVTLWDPPHRVGFTFHPSRPPETAGDVEVRFETRGGGTLVTLTHGGWERLGPRARLGRHGYNLGWNYIVALYAGQTDRPVVRIVRGIEHLQSGWRRLTRRR